MARLRHSEPHIDKQLGDADACRTEQFSPIQTNTIWRIADSDQHKDLDIFV